MSKNTYHLSVEMPRKAVVAAVKAGYRGPITVTGDLTDENLNWMSEFPASEGWSQNKVGKRGDRSVLMIITRDDD